MWGAALHSGPAPRSYALYLTTETTVPVFSVIFVAKAIAFIGVHLRNVFFSVLGVAVVLLNQTSTGESGRLPQSDQEPG